MLWLLLLFFSLFIKSFSITSVPWEALVQTNSQGQDSSGIHGFRGAYEFPKIAQTRLSVHFSGMCSSHQILKET